MPVRIDALPIPVSARISGLAETVSVLTAPDFDTRRVGRPVWGSRKPALRFDVGSGFPAGPALFRRLGHLCRRLRRHGLFRDDDDSARRGALVAQHLAQQGYRLPALASRRCPPESGLEQRGEVREELRLSAVVTGLGAGCGPTVAVQGVKFSVIEALDDRSWRSTSSPAAASSSPRGARQKMSGFLLRERDPVSRRKHCWTPEIVPNCA